MEGKEWFYNKSYKLLKALRAPTKEPPNNINTYSSQTIRNAQICIEPGG